jgi:hypothetical protein
MSGQRLRAAGIWTSQNRHIKVNKAVSPTHQLSLLHNTYPYYSFLLEADSIQVHKLTGKNISVKNPNDPNGNRTPNLCLVAQCLKQILHPVPHSLFKYKYMN